MTIEMPELQSLRHEPQMFSRAGRKPGGKEHPAAEVGFFLRREREMCNIALEAASEATGIHTYHIKAIEGGDLAHMPPRMEAMEMIAGYAQYLGFEPEPLIAHLFAILPPPPIAQSQYHPARPPILSSAKVLSFGKMPRVPSLNIRLSSFPGGMGGVISAVAVVMMLAVGAHWMFSGTIQPNVATQSAQVATIAANSEVPVADALATASTNAADAKSLDATALGIDKAASAIVPEVRGEMGSFIQNQVNGLAAKSPQDKPPKVVLNKNPDRVKFEEQIRVAAAAAIPQPADGRIYGAENKDARLLLKATAPVWLRIEDAQGNAVMTQMLNTGDTYRVPNRDGLIALSRDGGKLAYSIDGQEKGLLGPAGKILVSEKLDIATLEARKKSQLSAN